MLGLKEMVFMLPFPSFFLLLRFLTLIGFEVIFIWDPLSLHFFPVTSYTNVISCEQAQTPHKFLHFWKPLKVQTFGGGDRPKYHLISNCT